MVRFCDEFGTRIAAPGVRPVRGKRGGRKRRAPYAPDRGPSTARSGNSPGRRPRCAASCEELPSSRSVGANGYFAVVGAGRTSVNVPSLSTVPTANKLERAGAEPEAGVTWYARTVAWATPCAAPWLFMAVTLPVTLRADENCTS